MVPHGGIWVMPTGNVISNLGLYLHAIGSVVHEVDVNLKPNKSLGLIRKAAPAQGIGWESLWSKNCGEVPTGVHCRSSQQGQLRLACGAIVEPRPYSSL